MCLVFNHRWLLLFKYIYTSSQSCTAFIPGIQLFMCLYGLTVYLECPPEVRKARTPYIFINFIILFLYILGGLSDGYQTFQLLYFARVTNLGEFRQQIDHSWWAIACLVSGTSVNWIADALLVCISTHLVSTSSQGFDTSYIDVGSSWLAVDGYVFH